MNNEIKFINYNGIEGYIELMKHDVEPLNNPDCKRIDLYYDGKDIKAVLDYITNLQKIEQQYSAILSENAELENKITNLQEELEGYKQERERILNKLDYVKKNKELQQENEKIRKMNLYKQQYASRMEDRYLIEKYKNVKAIDYIKSESWFCYKDNEEVIDRTPVEELIKILEGDNND